MAIHLTSIAIALVKNAELNIVNECCGLKNAELSLQTQSKFANVNSTIFCFAILSSLKVMKM